MIALFLDSSEPVSAVTYFLVSTAHLNAREKCRLGAPARR